MNSMTEEHSINTFDEQVSTGEPFGLFAAPTLTTLQANIGLKCNLTCRHCHVNSSPQRKEEMGWDTMESILALAKTLDIQTIDITGGAPEMNPHFKRYVSAIRSENIQVIVRTNLTIHLEEGYEDFIEFFRDTQVQLVASLPCYLEENVDKQRGEGVYYESIEVIRKLNAVGYGEDPSLLLNLVYNPAVHHSLPIKNPWKTTITANSPIASASILPISTPSPTFPSVASKPICAAINNWTTTCTPYAPPITPAP
jgi:radical SAM/Cys-rich protein